MSDPFKIVDEYLKFVPVPVFEMIGALGLDLEFFDLEDDVSGWIDREDGAGYRIVVNANHALVRQRFTAAHELGHYLYHKDLFGDGVGDTRAYRADKSPLPNAKIRPVHERQANSFAANILMPESSISRLKEEGISEPRLLADRFQVSEAAMRIRLGLPTMA